MEEIRVLHIGLSHNIGGIETVVYSWFRHKPDWIKFDFINTGDLPLAFEEEFRNAGGRIFRITARKKNPVKSSLELKKIVSEGNYDFVHQHIMSFSWPEPCLVVNRLKQNTQMILHAHWVLSKDHDTKHKILDAIGRLRLAREKYLPVACGKEAGAVMFRGAAFRWIKNGIDFDALQFDAAQRQRIRAELGIQETDVVIGHVGRSSYEKNYPFLLKCFEKLTKQRANYKLLLIGNILQDDSIQGAIDSLGIREKVICTGVVPGAAPYYNAMDVFFLPSIMEGVSVALLEAQSSGLPCVASKNVAKESKISNRFTFVEIDNFSEAVAAIENAAGEIDTERRKQVELDESYKIEITSESMMIFYKEMQKQRNV